MNLFGVFTDSHDFAGERKTKENHFDNGQPDETKD